MADPPPQLFTRGQPGDADTRGDSMVMKHLARQKQQQEAEALAALARALPGTSEALLRTALEACAWDVQAAQAHLREFTAASGGASRPADGSSSSSSDGSSSDSSGSEGGAGRKRRRHGKEDKKSKRSKKEKHEKHEKKKKKSRGKKDKERKAERKHAAIGADQFGKYGIVKETDLWEKQPEFNAWLTDVKQRNPETLQKWEERDMFKEFMEDFNTATMPHKKYYSLERYHAKQAARAAKHGGAGDQERTDFANLEDERKRELAAERERAKAGSTGASLIEHMRMVGKLDGLREQQALQKQLQLAAQLGDNDKVRQLQAKLAPDDPRKSAAAQNYGFRPSR